ncbi:DUF4932 domain-containing protein [Pedobacter sp. SYP-B3415]|uniref:DUF4932 domain-containing protein n=1 Tax=Pedobacter sp. SYP-B3415 TaxID=2496641 RepID=UPI00210527AD|nr:DUF4932 domain-containing protein [Pedobacter sp. SYP-B3415]
MSSYAQKFSTYKTEFQGAEYRVDPRIELFNIVCMLFGHNGMTQHNITYKQQALDRFSPYKKHPVVDSVLNTFRKGWTIDDPVFFMLCLDKKFKLREGLSHEQLSRGGGAGRLQELARLFQDFVLKTGFDDWFNNTQRPFYQQVIAETAYNFRSFGPVRPLEAYFGERHRSYTVILNLLSGYGNFGRAFAGRGSSDLYAVVETTSASAGRPVFTPSISVFNLIVHEFGHGFVNPALDPLIAGADAYSWLYEPIAGDMKRAGYQSWRSTVYETVVPAIVCRIARITFGEEFARKNFYNPTVARGFIYADVIINKLREYEACRKQYPDFRSFAPELLTVFASVKKEDIDFMLKKIDSIRKPVVDRIPKPYDFARNNSTFFILGTHEPDKQAESAMHAWVKKYRDVISGDSPLITDDEALKLDLRGRDLVVFGTPAGNFLLKRYMSQVPVVIEQDGISANQKIAGQNLQLVTSWPNPADSKKTMVIYTAQQTADIVNFHYSPNKDQYGYWIAQNTITLDRGEYVNHCGIWTCDPSR